MGMEMERKAVIPTTDEMDRTTPEERNALVAECSKCGHWQYFTKQKVVDHETQKELTSLTAGITCDNCGGHDFRIGSVQSQRTFNAATAKRKTRRR